MQISSRFTIAVQVLTCIDVFHEKNKITSNFLAKSINVNPVIIRNVLQQLKNQGLVEVKRGSGGASLGKDASEISFYDVYKAVDSVDHGELFHFHENPNIECPVGRNIHTVLDQRLRQAQDAFESELKSIKLKDVFVDIKKLIKNQSNSKL